MYSHPFHIRKGTPTKTAVALMVVAAAAIIVPAAAHAASRHAKPVLKEGVGMRAQPSVRVREVQRALVRHGYSVGKAGVDGRFGPRTRAAVRRAQHRHHLKADGVVGQRTRAALDLGARPHRATEKHRRAKTTHRRATKITPAAAIATAPAPAASTPAPAPAATSPATPTTTSPAPVHLTTNHSTSPFLILGPLVALITGLFALVHVRQRRRHQARIAAYHLSTFVPPSLKQGGHEEPVAPAPEEPPSAAVPGSPPRSPSGFGNGARVIGYVTEQSAKARAPELEIERACQRSGWQLAEIVCDHDNGSILERPGMSRALERIAKGEAQGLVVSGARLLSRSADFATFVRWFRDTDRTLIALDLGLDTSTPEGRKLAGALITLNGWAGEWIASRSQRTPAAVSLNGARPGRLAISERPKVLARIASKHDDGMTPDEIADQLNKEGVPTLFGTEKWWPSTIQTALRYWRAGSATGLDERPSNERRARA